MFYLTTHSTHFIYGYITLVKDYEDSERGNPISRIAHTTPFVIPIVKHWLEREIAPWVYHEGSTIEPWTDALPRSYISRLKYWVKQFRLQYDDKLWYLDLDKNKIH